MAFKIIHEKYEELDFRLKKELGSFGQAYR